GPDRFASEGPRASPSRRLAPHQARVEELVEDLAELEGAAVHLVHDLADGALAVDRLEHEALLASQVRLLAHALDRHRIREEHLVEVEAALDEPPLVDAAEALHHE